MTEIVPYLYIQNKIIRIRFRIKKSLLGAFIASFLQLSTTNKRKTLKNNKKSTKSKKSLLVTFLLDLNHNLNHDLNHLIKANPELILGTTLSGTYISHFLQINSCILLQIGHNVFIYKYIYTLHYLYCYIRM